MNNLELWYSNWIYYETIMEQLSESVRTIFSDAASDSCMFVYIDIYIPDENFVCLSLKLYQGYLLRGIIHNNVDYILRFMCSVFVSFQRSRRILDCLDIIQRYNELLCQNSFRIVWLDIIKV